MRGNTKAWQKDNENFQFSEGKSRLFYGNPQYSINKFRWRCCILFLFGVINKTIYTSDILCWYGINGLLLSLLPIRDCKTSSILYLSILLFLVGIQPFIILDHYIYPEIDYALRYLQNADLTYIISYPRMLVFKADIHMLWPRSTTTLSFFIFGYYLGKSKIVENLSRVIRLKMIIFLFLLSIVSYSIYKHNGYHPSLRQIFDLNVALLYSTIFIYIYNKNTWLKFLDNYGKLGLTNYSMQNWLPIIFIIYIFIPLMISLEYIYLFSITFYILQITFSYYWLKRYEYGPLEYIWRITTNLKYSSNKKKE